MCRTNSSYEADRICTILTAINAFGRDKCVFEAAAATAAAKTAATEKRIEQEV